MTADSGITASDAVQMLLIGGVGGIALIAANHPHDWMMSKYPICSSLIGRILEFILRAVIWVLWIACIALFVTGSMCGLGHLAISLDKLLPPRLILIAVVVTLLAGGLIALITKIRRNRQ
jgi:hypothetical protein